MTDMESYFKKGVKLVGVLKAKNPVRMGGEFQGDVEAQKLFVVESSGRFVGNIQAGDLANEGIIEGDIKASNKVDLKSQSKLTGNVSAFQFAVEEGAGFDGRCQMAGARKDKISEAPTKTITPTNTKSKKKRSSNTFQFKNAKSAFGFGKIISGVLILIGLAALVWNQSGPLLGEPPADQAGIHLDNAVEFIKAGKSAEAVNEFNRAVEIQPSDPRAYFGLAEIYFDNKRYHKARPPLKKAIGLAPKIAKYHVRLADVYLAEKRWDEALIEYETGVKLDPKNHLAFYGMSRVYEEQDKPKRVVASLKKAVKLASKDYELRKAFGAALIRQGQVGKGTEQFMKALKIRQDDPAFFIETGDLLLSLKRRQEAYRYFKKAALILPGDFQGQIRAEDWYFEKSVLDDFIKTRTGKSGENDEAGSEKELSLAELQDAARLKPENARAQFQLGLALVSGARLKEARQAFEKSISLDSSLAEAHFELGKVLTSEGRMKPAIESLKTALSYQPANAGFLLALGKAQVTARNYDDGVAVLLKAEAAAPDDPQIQLAMCNAYRKKVFYTKGIEYCKKAADLKANYFEAMNRLAWLYAKKKINLDEGIDLSQKTLEKFPEKHEYIDTLSELYFAKGEAEKAAESIKVAIKLAPGKKYYQRQLERFQKK